MPEAATAEEIERVYIEGWKLGLKAIAIYRDGSKRSQPLSTGKKKDEGPAVDAETLETIESLRRQLAAAQAEAALPHRRRLPAERTALTHKFDIAGHEGYITVGLYPDGQPGEIFLKMAKEGSTVSGLMDSFATSVSLALQYGVPLRDLVNKFAHVRFEPSGFTGNQEIPIAKSIVDYIFRWLGSRFLPSDEKASLGLIDRSAIVHEAPLGFGGSPSPSSPAPAEPTAAAHPSMRARSSRLRRAVRRQRRRRPSPRHPRPSVPLEAAVKLRRPRRTHRARRGEGRAGRHGVERHSERPRQRQRERQGPHQRGPRRYHPDLGGTKVSFQTQADAPSCAECGSIMVRNGSCYKCLNCGSTSGCSSIREFGS